MEAEERPTKMRKLDNDVVNSSEQSDAQESTNASINNANEVEKCAKNIDSDSDSDYHGNNDDDTANPPDENVGTENEAPAPAISKNQLKKLRRQEQWEASKAFRKAKRKEKAVEKKQRKREARGQASEGADESKPPPAAPASDQKPRSILLPITFVIDCGYDDLMLDKERISLSSQLTRCYSDNHHAPFQAHLAASSFGAKLKERFETVLHNNHKNWRRVKFREANFVDVSNESAGWMKDKSGVPSLDGVFASKREIPRGELHDGREVVYLSSESPNTLQELKPFSTYIVGGLVDKNRHKGICYKTARDKGIKTARLPISEFMEMQSRSVLATNHVVEIMLRWLECGDWGKAFLKVIPKRKGGSLKLSTSLDVVNQAQNVCSLEREQEDQQKVDSVETL